MGVVVMAEVALTLLLLLLALAGVVLPAGADCHHQDGDHHQHNSMGELVGRDNPKVVFLPLCDLLLHLLLQVLPLLPSLNFVNILCVAPHVLEQQLIQLTFFALLCARGNALLAYHFLIGFREGHIFADEGGDFDNAVLASDGAHAGLDEGQLVVLPSRTIVLPAKQPATQKQLHSAAWVVLAIDLHVLSVDWLRNIYCRSLQEEAGCQQDHDGEGTHVNLTIRDNLYQAMSEDRARSIPRNSSQQTRIRLLSGFQESYLEEKRSSSDDFRSHSEEDHFIHQKFMEETYSALKQQIRQTQMLIQFEKSIKTFLLGELEKPSKPIPKREKLMEIASEYLGSASKFAEDMMELQSELQK